MSQQYSYRSQNSLGIVGAAPSYDSVKGFEVQKSSSRIYRYSPDGRLYAYVLSDRVRVHYAENAELLRELLLPNIVDISFSPRGTYISTWERIVRLEDNQQHKNMRVFSVSSGEELISFTQRSQIDWELSFTISESHAVQLVGSEIQVYHPADWSKGVIDKIKIEGIASISLSPGLNPSLAVFVAGKNGQASSLRVYKLLSLSSPPIAQKSTFRAEHAQFKWNTIGTQVLALIRTDVDATNKSYYGETRLFILSTAGNINSQVAAPNEGPIHDFAWSPNSKEFGVICGNVPPRSVIFDNHLRIVHDFGSDMCNFISFNPQGRLVALAGFGNMSGKINVYDRRTITKITTIDAPNTTICEWSPDGRSLLTATLSPRLRVDNGIKIWHCTGPLLHVQPLDELYQASWRPIPVDAIGPFPNAIPAAPEPNPSVALHNATAKKASSGSVGFYRPPGARERGERSSVYDRTETPSPAGTPGRQYSPGPGPNGHYGNGGNGRGRGTRIVPGAAPPSSNAATGRDEKKIRKRGKGKKPEDAPGEAPASSIAEESKLDARGEEDEVEPSAGDSNAVSTPSESTPLDAVAKKIRNLNKKLKAIEELKERASRGDRLEGTQLLKIESGPAIQAELDQLSRTSHGII